MDSELNKKIERAKMLYQQYIDQVKKLNLRQEKIVLEFMKRKEKEHLEKIRREIKNNQ